MQSLQDQIDRGGIHPIQVRVVVLCALVTLIEGIDLTLIPLLAPSISASWSLSPDALGIIFSTGPIGLILGGLGVGYLSDRIGRRGALIAAMVLMTAATLANAWVSTVAQLLVCRLLTGIAFGGVIPAAVALVSEFLPVRTRPSVVAMVILGQAAGGLLAALLVKLPIADGPWQQLVLYVGFGCALVTVLIFLLLPESPRYLALREAGSARLQRILRALGIATAGSVESLVAGHGGRLGELFAPGRALGTSLLWATFIGMGWAVSFFTNWLTKIYTHAGQAADAGVDGMAWYSAGAIVGGLVLPLFARRWHADKVLIASIFLAAIACVGMGQVIHLAASINLAVAFLCGVFVSGAFFMLYPPAVRFYPTDMRSTGIGAAVAFGRIGNTLSPALAGTMLGAGLAPATVFWAMAAPMLMSCVAMGLFHRHAHGR